MYSNLIEIIFKHIYLLSGIDKFDLVYLIEYQHPLGYLMLKFDSFVNI